MVKEAITLYDAMALAKTAEKIQNEKSKIKLYLLAVDVYRILTGRRPFPWQIKKIPELLKTAGLAGEKPGKYNPQEFDKTLRWFSVRLLKSRLEVAKSLEVSEAEKLMLEFIRQDVENLLNQVGVAHGGADFVKNLSKQMEKIESKLETISIEQIESRQEVRQMAAVVGFSGIAKGASYRPL